MEEKLYQLQYLMMTDLDVSNLVSGFYTTRVTIAGKTSVSKLIVK